MTMTSLVCVLHKFCDMRHERDLEERNNRCPKRRRVGGALNQNIDPFLDLYMEPTTGSGSSLFQWQLQDYSHQRSVP